MFFKITVFLATFLVCRKTLNAQTTDVSGVSYSDEQFRTEVARKDHFVMFYTTWCKYSMQLMPTWDELASKSNDSEVQIAKIDCDLYGTLCSQNHITGYPTLIFFKAGRRQAIKYMGKRTLHDLEIFVNEHKESSSR